MIDRVRRLLSSVAALAFFASAVSPHVERSVPTGPDHAHHAASAAPGDHCKSPDQKQCVDHACCFTTSATVAPPRIATRFGELRRVAYVRPAPGALPPPVEHLRPFANPPPSPILPIV